MQSPKTLWFTGLSGAGKTTLARGVAEALRNTGAGVFCVDGDELREGISADLGYSCAERHQNVLRAAHLARLAQKNHLIGLFAFMSPLASMRRAAADIIGREQFFEIYVKSSLQTCMDRDPKGIYRKFREGRVCGLSGLDSPFEEPEAPFCTVSTEQGSPAEAIALILAALGQKSRG